MIRLHSVFFDDLVPNWRRAASAGETIVIVLVVHGQVAYEVDGRPLTLSKGDVLITYPGAVRAGGNGPFPPHRKYSAHFELALPEAFPDRERFEAAGYRLFRTRKFEYVLERFEQLYSHWSHRTPLHDFASQGLVMELYGSLLLELERPNLPARKQRLAAELEAYIRSRFTEDIRIGDLAELAGLTPNYVSSLFKEATGLTPIQYVHRLRVSVARDLLAHTDMTVSEISDYLGYCEPAYFNRMFKRATGVPPSALAKGSRE